jgi:hypothetical protein
MWRNKARVFALFCPYRESKGLSTYCFISYSAYFDPEYKGWFFIKASKTVYFHVPTRKIRISTSIKMLSPHLFFLRRVGVFQGERETRTLFEGDTWHICAVWMPVSPEIRVTQNSLSGSSIVPGDTRGLESYTDMRWASCDSLSCVI